MDLFTEMLSEPEQINANNILITEQNNTEYDPSTPVKGNSLAEFMISHMNQLSDIEKQESQSKINLVQQTFPELCKD